MAQPPESPGPLHFRSKIISPVTQISPKSGPSIRPMRPARSAFSTISVMPVPSLARSLAEPGAALAALKLARIGPAA